MAFDKLWPPTGSGNGSLPLAKYLLPALVEGHQRNPKMGIETSSPHSKAGDVESIFYGRITICFNGLPQEKGACTVRKSDDSSP